MAQLNLSRFEEVLRREMAKRLIKVAIIFIGEMQRSLSTSYPPASVPGEYPHWRTGTGRSNVSYAPSQLSQVMTALSVKCGVREPGMHIADLEIKHGRLGFLATFDRMRPRLEQALQL